MHLIFNPHSGIEPKCGLRKLGGSRPGKARDTYNCRSSEIPGVHSLVAPLRAGGCFAKDIVMRDDIRFCAVKAVLF